MTLPPGWYAFADPREFSRKHPTHIRRFGEDWVIWWHSSGQWIAQVDRCPHRGARLSLGSIHEDCIQCPFHGFRFDHTGKCSYVPEIKRDAPGLLVATFALTERFDFLWINWGQSAQKEIPWFSDLQTAGYTYASAKKTWKKHFTRSVENQLDYAHLPFVHASSIGRSFDPTLKVQWQFDQDALRVVLGSEKDSTGYFEFRFPNVWKLFISPKLVQTLMFVPVDENETCIYSRSYHRFTTIPVLKQAIAWISAKWANPWILAQDERVVISQMPNDVRDARDEQLFPSDRAIQAFRKMLKQQ